MDPFSAIIAIVLIFQILKKGPEVVADMARAAQEAWDNAEHKERIKKLAAGGVAPASRGGAFGRYVGNLVRAARLDAEARSAAKAAKQAGAGKTPGRFQQRVAAAAAAWRARNAATSGTSGTYVDPSSDPHIRRTGVPVVDLTPPGDGGPQVTEFTVPGDVQDDEPRPPIHADATVGPRDRSGGGGGREPVLVGAVVGGATLAVGAGDHPAAPTAAPLAVGTSGPAPALTATAVPALSTAPAIEGTTHMSSGTVEVTGVSSGAAAAQRLASDIQAATDAFAAQLAAFQRRIIEMAAQGHGQVGLGGHSNAIQGLAQANEAMAAARGQVSTMTAEVIPLVNAVRRAYLAIH